MAKNDREQIRRLREEANALREQAEAKKRRQRMVAQIGTVIAALAIIGIIVFVTVMAPQWFGNRNTPEATGTVSVASAEGEPSEVPIEINGDGITVGKAEAPDTIDYYVDFSCPHCRDYHLAMDSTYQGLIAEGKIKVNYHFIRYVDDYGMRAGGAMAAAVKADPASFYSIVDSLFEVDAQTQVGWSEADYAAHLQSLGITNPEVIEAVNGGDYNWWIMDRSNAARSAGVKGTPSVALNGTVLQNLPTPETLGPLLDGVSEDELAESQPPAPTDTTSEDDGK